MNKLSCTAYSLTKGLKIMRTLNKVNVMKNDTIETYAHCSQCTYCSCGNCACEWDPSDKSTTDRNIFSTKSKNVYNNSSSRK